MERLTLIDIFIKIKENKSKGITFIGNAQQDSFTSYWDIFDEAHKCLYFLQEQGLKPKDELIFQLEDNKTFIITFWACLLGGIIPIPLTVGNKEHHLLKLFTVWKVLDNPFLISTAEHILRIREFAKLKKLDEAIIHIEGRFINVNDPKPQNVSVNICSIKEEDVAFIQFSSGSTGQPKGVILTHKNLIINTRDIGTAARYSSDDSTLSWMPLTHDMGLIGFHINPLVCNMNQFIMSTNSFVRRPSIWLDKATQYKTTILSSPNFGYNYVLKHTAKNRNNGWDLSHVRILYNGAEPISKTIATNFLEKMNNYGMKPSAMCPVYGLAEGTLAVSISSLDQDVQSYCINRNDIRIGCKIVILENPLDGLSFVNVGRPIEHCFLQIVNLNNTPIKDEFIGKIRIKGDSVTSGYYNDEIATKRTIDKKGWLDTGDIGFMKEGNLYITGRFKDIIFLNGQNYYPHDLEDIACEVENVELNKIVFTGFFNEKKGFEEIIGFVYFRGPLEEFVPLSQKIKVAINSKLGLVVKTVLPVKNIPRTTSGKLQRYKLLELYLDNVFKPVESELFALAKSITEVGQQFIKPKNENEEKLLAIWSKVFEVKIQGVNQGFLELGGDSLKATEVIMCIWQEFNVEIEPDKFFLNLTIEEFALILTKSNKQKYNSIPVIEELDSYPLSSVQKRLYQVWKLDKSSIAYNLPLGFKIQGDFEGDKIENCIRTLIERHNSLRISFSELSEPCVVVNKNIDFSLDSKKCSHKELENKLKNNVRPFNLHSAPLFRIKMLELGNREYVLFIDFHHIISDGISVFRFLNELMDLYHGRKLKSIPNDYKDFVFWEASNRGSNKLKRQKRFWSDYLSILPDALELPLDYLRPPIFSTKGKKLKSSFSKKTSLRLRKVALENNCTLNVLLLAIYRILLARYTGQEEFLIGMPVAGRNHPDIQNIHGMFVNNLAVRNIVNEEDSFLEFLSGERLNMLNILANKEYPYEELLKLDNSNRDVSRNPFFDTMFIFQSRVEVGNTNMDFSVTNQFFDPGFSKFDLSMEVYDNRKDCLEYHIEYASSLFTEKSMAAFSKCYKKLTEGILKNPGKKIREYSLITSSEFKRDIIEFNETEHCLPNPKPVHILFEEYAKRMPTNIALEHHKEILTYEDLNAYSDNVAVNLLKNGFTPTLPVAVIMNKSFEYIISIIGVLKAGGCFIPIDPYFLENKIENILEDSEAQIILTSKKYISKLKSIKDKFQELVLEINDLMRKSKSVAIPDFFRDLSDKQAYVLYTSGSTGRPKGVMVSHASLVNYILWASKTYANNEPSTFPLFTSISFDLTLTSIFVPLISGNKIVIYDHEEPSINLKSIFEENKVNVIKLTPSHLKILNGSSIDISSSMGIVKKLIVGGEDLEFSLATSIFNKFKSTVKIYNEYGPTEATIGCMVYEFEPKDDSVSVSLGFPIWNTQIYLLDKYLNPVPANVHGELYVSGKSLLIGYLNDEDLDKSRLISNPFIKGKKMYKTGDIAKRLNNGKLVYIGRNDLQVKINGNRIELAEIELYLKLNSEIRECIVCVRRTENEKNLLCAFYTTVDNRDISSYDLTSYLATKVAHYMIPSYFEKISRIPITRNGKTDYKTLKEIPFTKVFAKNEEPTTTEVLVLDAWEEILQEKGLDITTNFYEIGGDSIKAVQIASILKQKGLNISAKDILTFHTVQRICQNVFVNGRLNSYEQGEIVGEKKLTPIESWFFNQNFVHEGYYNQSILLKFNKEINLEILTNTFQKLVVHHDGLRLNYNPKNKSLFFNHKHLDPRSNQDIVNVNIDEIFSFIDFQTILDKGFDINKDLLIKATVFKENNLKKWLYISAHHLVVDGVSWRILLEDFKKIYTSILNGVELKLNKKTASVIEWKEHLDHFYIKNDTQKEKKYWTRINSTKFSIPHDFNTDEWEMGHSRKIQGILAGEETEILKKVAHKFYKTNVLVLLLVALARTLKEWTGKEYCLIELENHGRHLHDVDVSRTIGWFTSLYPIVIELNELNEIDDQIKYIKQLVEQIPNHGLGYGFQRFDQRNGEANRASLRFNYLGEFGSELSNELFSYSEFKKGKFSSDENHMTTELELNSMLLKNTFKLEIIFNSKAHKVETIQWFLNTFFSNLKMITNITQNQRKLKFTPADFESAEISQEELDSLFEK